MMAVPAAPLRILGPFAAASVVVGMVVGAGIFRSASVVAATLNNDALVLMAWALGGLFALAGALVYAELASAFAHPGGDYRFLGLAFGPLVAFLFAWSRFAVIFSASAALLAFVAADYVAELVSLSAGARGGVAALAIVVLTALNLAGVKRSTGGQVVLVTGDVIALLALCVAAVSLIASGAPALNPTAAPQPFGAAAFGQAMVFVMLAYGGFNDAATLSAEVRRPRDMILALVGGMALVTALYVLANWAYLTGLGGAGLAASAAPAAQLMALAFGRPGQVVMVVFVTLAALAIINALVIVGGRTLYAVAGNEPALARLAAWDAARGVPRGAIWVQCSLSLVLIGWGSMSTGFAQMVDFLSPVFWLFLSLTGPALIILRRSAPDVPRPFRVPLYPLVPLAFCAGCLFVLQSSLRYVGWQGAAISFGVLGAGLIVRLVLKAPPKAPVQSPREM